MSQGSQERHDSSSCGDDVSHRRAFTPPAAAEPVFSAIKARRAQLNKEEEGT